MAGAMRKMAVYLGLVEPGQPYEPYEDPQYAYVGADGADVDVDDAYDAPAADRAGGYAEPPPRRGSSVAPRRAEPMGEVLRHPSASAAPAPPAPARRTADLSTIAMTSPRTYNEARQIGESFRDGVPVIMNLAAMDDSDAKRLVDFAAGLTFGLHGTLEKVAHKVFLLSPGNVQIADEDRARIAHGEFYNQS
jgi:cell division inhibitor SepF